MKREVTYFDNQKDWLEARKKFITSTEVAALFGAGSFVKTEYQLHHLKVGNVQPEDFKENERVKWGLRLESAIANGIAEDLGLVVEPFRAFISIPEIRLAASFDFKVIGIVDGFSGDERARDMFRQHGPGVLEIKNIDSLQFKRGWIEDDGEVEAPVQYEMQIQSQLEVSDLGWGILAPLVGGNTPKPVLRERDRDLGALIREKAAHFWARVDAGVAPEPDFTKDGDTISKLYVDNDGSSIDLSDNPHVADLCRAYKAAGEEEKAASERKKAAKAELLTIIEAAKSVQADGFKISAGTNKEVFKSYDRAAGQMMRISISQLKEAHIEATVPAYRNVRITQQSV